MSWLKPACSTSGKTLNVALMVWFLASVKKETAFAVNRSAMLHFDLNRFALNRGLQKLAALKLIELESSRGKRARVKIIGLPELSLKRWGWRAPPVPSKTIGADNEA